MSNYIESTKRKLRSSITQLCDTSMGREVLTKAELCVKWLVVRQHIT